MHIKYCEPHQFNKLKTIEKYPHELHPIMVPSKAWLQIGAHISIHRAMYLHKIKIFTMYQCIVCIFLNLQGLI